MSRNYELTNQYFRNTSYYPENGYDGEKGVCYHFRYGNALFIMLNNENMHSDENLAKAQNWVKMAAKAVDFLSVYYGNLGNSLWNLLFDHRLSRFIFPLLLALEYVVENSHRKFYHKRQSYEIELPV